VSLPPCQRMHSPAACAGCTMCNITELLQNITESLQNHCRELWNITGRITEPLRNVAGHYGSVMEPLRDITEHYKHITGRYRSVEALRGVEEGAYETERMNGVGVEVDIGVGIGIVVRLRNVTEALRSVSEHYRSIIGVVAEHCGVLWMCYGTLRSITEPLRKRYETLWNTVEHCRTL